MLFTTMETSLLLENCLKTKFLVCLGAFAFCLHSQTALAEGLAPSPVPHSYTLGTGENYPPFSDKSLPDGGMATAIVKAAFAAIDIPVTITWTSWKRAESQAESGKFAAIFPYMLTAEREKKFAVSSPLYTMHSFFYVRSSDKIISAAPESLRGKRLCRPTGYGNEQAVQKLIDDGTIVVTSAQSQETCFRQLLHQRADLVVEAEIVAQQTILKTLGANAGITHLPDPIAKIELGLMAATGKKSGMAAIRDFNRGLAIIQKKGTYNEISKRFVECSSPPCRQTP